MLDEDGDIIPEHPMSYPYVLETYHPEHLVTNDIRDNSPAKYHHDILTTEVKEPKYDMVITNPPFNIALDIIKKSFEFTVD